MTGLIGPAAVGAGLAAMLALSACQEDTAKSDVVVPTETAAATAAVPEAVNGWREYPLREGVISTQPFKWRSDSIDIPVPAGGELEYKLEMKKGQGIVYAINYVDLLDPSVIVSEFHGHTEKGADGNGDLMFYSKANGVTENGVFSAPWDGIHGWYLKNTSDKAVNVKLDVAGFYKRLDQ
ncbi:MAG: hypothetical protein Q8R02_03650 [Hyphomonadaceae bacterium]|nr:hypothetical protein [Hyphomonadaceae bacterium]